MIATISDEISENNILANNSNKTKLKTLIRFHSPFY